jgi:sulfide:quinone oxidoreductase
VVHDEILSVNLDAREVVCQDTGTHRADYIIIGLGVQPNPTPLVKDTVLSICNFDHCLELRRRISTLAPGSSVLVTATRMPYQCPPAPFEFAFLIHDMLQQRGIRDQVRLALAVPTHKAVPIECPERIQEAMRVRNIEFLPGVQPQSITANIADGTHTVNFMPHPKFNPDGKVCAVPPPFTANIVCGTWPQTAAKVLAPFCDDSGFLPVDTATLRTKYENVYCIGDSASMMLPTMPEKKPHPKAGGFAEGQGRIAMLNVLSGAAWNAPAPFRQDASCATSCTAELGVNEACLVTIDLHTSEGCPLYTTAPSTSQHKVEWVAERFNRHFTTSHSFATHDMVL